MAYRPAALVFDSFGTLLDLRPLSERLEAVGVPGHALGDWFQRTLQRGRQLDDEGEFRPFHAVAADTLADTMKAHGAEPAPEAVETVLASLRALPLFEDVNPALILARDAGLRTAVLTNGDPGLVRAALAREGLQDHVLRYVGIEEVGHWKPRRETYLAVASAFGLAPGRLAMVSAHVWDVRGAREAGFSGGWVNRSGEDWPEPKRPPEAVGSDLVLGVERVLDLPHHPEAVPHPGK